ncbi:MAG: YggS family pyridoxal phosphate-dependent enzyme [Sphingomicrobium sp.]
MSAAFRLQNVRRQIAAAIQLSGRKDSVRLIAVSKNRTPDEIEPLLEAGQRDFGESRVQEASAKWPALLARYPDVRLHCIGRLQSNKAGAAARLFNAIHSVDRPSLLRALVDEPENTGRGPNVWVQVNIGGESQKGGCAIEDVGEMVAAVRASALPFAGLMAIPPEDKEPSPFFALLAKLARRHDVAGLSMGMSSDFGAAIMLGATDIRVGTALFEG